MIKSVIKIVNSYKLSMVAIALLLYLSFNNAHEYDNLTLFIFPHADKVIHFLMYFGVASALYIDFIWLNRKRATSIVLILTVLLAGVTEVGQQLLTDTRSGDIWDFVCNIMGGVIATSLAPYTAKLYFKFINYVRGVFK
ncbi:MAG: VanZ family protein [Bacteroidales bacterium]|nr:VanZ family protein [Bacteroidales bacterium]